VHSAGSRKNCAGGFVLGMKAGNVNVEFLAAVAVTVAQSGYINAIQPNLHGSGTETRAKNSHRTDRLGRGGLT